MGSVPSADAHLQGWGSRSQSPIPAELPARLSAVLCLDVLETWKPRGLLFPRLQDFHGAIAEVKVIWRLG